MNTKKYKHWFYDFVNVKGTFTIASKIKAGSSIVFIDGQVLSKGYVVTNALTDEYSRLIVKTQSGAIRSLTRSKFEPIFLLSKDFKAYF